MTLPLFDAGAAVSPPIRNRRRTPAPLASAAQQAELWQPDPGVTAPASAPELADELAGQSAAALLGFTHDSQGDTAGGFRLCLWAAVEQKLDAEGWPRHTWDYIHERDRRIAAIQHCSDCPGADTCRSWQLRQATLAARQELLRQGRDPELAWPLRWATIRAMFRRFRLPLPLWVHPDTSDIQDALESGATITANGLTFTPWPGKPVMLVTRGGL